MHAGHEERTRAVLEHARRMREKHVETRIEAIPPEIRAEIDDLRQRVEKIERFVGALLTQADMTLGD